jgi:histone-lysine N-methyltransferase SETMAR
LGWEILNHPPYSLDLTRSDYHLFGPMKDHLGGQKFKTDNKLKRGVLNWLCSQPTFFYAAGISALPWRWQKCVILEGQYLEKE